MTLTASPITVKGMTNPNITTANCRVSEAWVAASRRYVVYPAGADQKMEGLFMQRILEFIGEVELNDRANSGGDQ
jgi:hypothetical protein